MQNTAKNREWVKDAAIVFLVILLILTFFSNTIMNRALPEVSTQAVTSGSITARVRGTGTVTANGVYEVKADQTREVRTILIRAGQEVKAGDVLFALGGGDSEELQQAQRELEQLELSYQTRALSIKTYDYHDQQKKIDAAKAEEERADARYQKAYAAYMAAAGVDAKALAETREQLAEADKLMDAYSAARDAYDAVYEEWQTAEKTRFAAVAELEAAESMDDADPDKAQRVAEASAALDGANAALATAEVKLNAIRSDPSFPSEEEYVNAQNRQIELQGKDEALTNILRTKYAAETAALEQAELDLAAAQSRVEDEEYILYSTQQDEQRQNTIDYLNLADVGKQIQRQKEKIAQLSGEGDNQIVANTGGIVQSVNCTAGNKVFKDDVMCVIEVPDQGYSVSFNVTTDQAKRLHPGVSATISNYYWGSEIIATLETISSDPKNPQGNKTLNFSLEGDVTPGSNLTVSVGSKSANYDLIVPNSAIHSDTNGSFVYKMEAKNSALGNRYFAKRVSVEVLATDDLNSAITGDFESYGDFVITTSSAPIRSGDQVRMADQ